MAQEPVGFYTDTTVCIGCKACQVACHQWNDLPAELEKEPSKDDPGKARAITGISYDNTGSFSAVNWRHVKFIEKSELPDRSDLSWMMMSDVCKHCVNAPCLEVCPTGAIIRTEFDSVYIQENVCNGCRDCIAACPFGVIHTSGLENEGKGTAKKCTLCYDRLQHSLQPACSTACPTQSIQFGPISELKERAAARVEQLKAEGVEGAYLYGADEKVLGGLNSFYLLVDKPEVYGLPENPKRPSRVVTPSNLISAGAAVLMGIGAAIAFRIRRVNDMMGRRGSA